MKPLYLISVGTILFVVGLLGAYLSVHPRANISKGTAFFSVVSTERGGGTENTAVTEFQFCDTLSSVPAEVGRNEPFHVRLDLHLTGFIVNGQSVDLANAADWGKRIQARLFANGEPVKPLEQTISSSGNAGQAYWVATPPEKGEKVELIVYLTRFDSGPLHTTPEPIETSVRIRTLSDWLRATPAGFVSILGVLGNVTGFLTFLRDRKKGMVAKKGKG